jgi:hypothetical protein
MPHMEAERPLHPPKALGNERFCEAPASPNSVFSSLPHGLYDESPGEELSTTVECRLLRRRGLPGLCEEGGPPDVTGGVSTMVDQMANPVPCRPRAAVSAAENIHILRGLSFEDDPSAHFDYDGRMPASTRRIGMRPPSSAVSAAGGAYLAELPVGALCRPQRGCIVPTHMSICDDADGLRDQLPIMRRPPPPMARGPGLSRMSASLED